MVKNSKNISIIVLYIAENCLDADVNNVVNIEENNITTKKCLKRRNYQQTYDDDCE